MHTYIHTYIHTHMHALIHSFIHSLHLYIYICTHTRVYVSLLFFIWGVDYKFTNYEFKQNVEFQTCIELTLLWQGIVWTYNGCVCSETIACELVVKSPYCCSQSRFRTSGSRVFRCSNHYFHYSNHSNHYSNTNMLLYCIT